ncbi:TetR/AcrR family transcriptional regulator [Mycolicibacterium komossense]|uniref:TetR/AcrR family transcriptional regulator C-terminal domain-containing protein n=1 Tax=Mycolicibacterium komossense TaxID=1779 RepID=A0ABT3C5Y3_9MYCO|nr:TetR/AcrR family transcriptional regulator C-terminal domain-containing protein [Mycolicibacterium komossense]MCV7224867.1 TetR/AcrR family transcriptional regulator C-terminal domain-containing protein [Mycolicibacterium komossense]
MRARFTLDEVQAAALEIVDRDGLSALSMRTLGAALGTGPMTLYNYVKNRDELEELVAEAVVADMQLPGRCDDWADEVRAVAGAMWDGVRRHPNAVPLVLTRRTVSASSYTAAARLVQALGTAGLTDETLLAAFRAVLALVMGSVQVELAGPSAPEGETAAAAAQIGALAAEEFRQLAALAVISQRSTPKGDFTRALDMLLAGVSPRLGT